MHGDGLRNSDVDLRKSQRMNNFFRNANRIVMEDDVQNFIRDLVHSKFRMKDREWHLVSSIEGINVYADQRNTNIEINGDYVSRNDLKECLTKAGGSSSLDNNKEYTQLGSMLKASVALIIGMEVLKWAPSWVLNSRFSMFVIHQDKVYANIIFFILFACAAKYHMDSSSLGTGSKTNEDAISRCLKPRAVPAQYILKAQFFVLGSPDELLTLILNEGQRATWDFDLVSATLNADENKTVLCYNGPGGKRFSETVEFSYMVHEQKFYIVEQANSSNLNEAKDQS